MNEKMYEALYNSLLASYQDQTEENAALWDVVIALRPHVRASGAGKSILASLKEKEDRLERIRSKRQADFHSTELALRTFVQANPEIARILEAL